MAPKGGNFPQLHGLPMEGWRQPVLATRQQSCPRRRVRQAIASSRLKGSTWALSWSPDGTRLVADNLVWQLKASDPPIQITSVSATGLYDVAWSPDGNFIALAQMGGGVRVVDLSRRRRYGLNLRKVRFTILTGQQMEATCNRFPCVALPEPHRIVAGFLKPINKSSQENGHATHNHLCGLPISLVRVYYERPATKQRSSNFHRTLLQFSYLLTSQDGKPNLPQVQPIPSAANEIDDPNSSSHLGQSDEIAIG